MQEFQDCDEQVLSLIQNIHLIPQIKYSNSCYLFINTKIEMIKKKAKFN